MLEDIVQCHRGVERYQEDLEEGHMEHKGILAQPFHGPDADDYRLVWNDMELQWGQCFQYYIDEHDMKVDEPVKPTLLRMIRPDVYGLSCSHCRPGC